MLFRSSVLVMLNGVVQTPGNAYSVTGTQLTFLTEAPLASDGLEVRFLTGSVVYAASPIYVSVPYTTVSTGGTAVDSFYSTQYRSANYEFVAKNATTGQYQTGEVFMIQNGITANAVGSIRSLLGTPTTAVITWSSTLDGFGVVSLVATAASNTTVVKLHKTYFNDN